MAIKAVVFDLDGTLLNTLDDIADSMNAVLAARGLPVHDTEKYKYFVGNGVAELARRVLPAGHSPELFEDVAAAYAERYAAHSADKTRPYPGVSGMLTALLERGLGLAVLSNKPHTATLAVVAQYFDGVGFSAVLGARDGVPVKPDPVGALELAQALGAQPCEILCLGDTSVDMLTAAGAGMIPVGALWGFRTEEELLESGAAHITRQPEELVPLADRL